MKPDIELYKTMALIRHFEERLLVEFGKNKFRGTTHTSLGQEAIAVASMSQIQENDWVFSTHRCHGHFLAYGGSPIDLLYELAGDGRGVCQGVGGSQHLHWKRFFSNGIQGGGMPVASGVAIAEKIKKSDAIVVCFLGDGTLGEGTVYESLNLASLWDLPILFVLENNQYAQSTPMKMGVAGSIQTRGEAFDIEVDEIESNDLFALLPRFRRAIDCVRKSGKPFLQIVNTYRLGPHSKGDDTREQQEIELWKRKNPLLLGQKYFEDSALQTTAKQVEKEVSECFAILNDETRTLPRIPNSSVEYPAKASGEGWVTDGDLNVVRRLQNTFKKLLQQNADIHLIGEDIASPYGGAFKVTSGLSDDFPAQVHTTPISEAGITGLASGMALQGFRPIVEIMFGDFLTLVTDQLVNHACKFNEMYGGDVTCPVILRTPMGGYRGYGPTHSQSLEKLFLGVPGLFVTALSPLHDPEMLWHRMLQLSSPCLHIENKKLYGRQFYKNVNGRIAGYEARSCNSFFPTFSLSPVTSDEKADVVILTRGTLIISVIA